MSQKIAVVTGASSGIGAATARLLSESGYFVYCVARRTDRIDALADQIGGHPITCDVSDEHDVAAMAEVVGPHVDLLVNNAGGALGMDSIARADANTWRRMYEMNVIGTVQVTRDLLPALEHSGAATIINIGSTAGHIAYEGGGGYTAAKHGVAVLTETLRLELHGKPIRVTEVSPGMVHTDEFSLVRLGSQEAADAVYAGVKEPLVADDVADVVVWVATRPRHVNIDHLVVKPLAQATQDKVHRE